MHPVTPAGVLAGRANELALLDGLLRDLARGSGNAVLIEGEPGIGKTALVRAALAAAAPGLQPHAAAHHGPAAGCQVFWGGRGQAWPGCRCIRSSTRCRSGRRRLTPGEVPSPACCGARSRPTAAPTCQALLAEQLIALTIDETSVQPVVLMIDDLHWADLATVKLSGRLARTAHQVPLLLIGVTRPIPQREDLFALRRGGRR